jgi:CTP:molybdopterin cytidylyltransferase MocA
VDAVVAANVGPVVVVTGAAESSSHRECCASTTTSGREGQAGSLAAGIAAGDGARDVDAVVVGLADQPFVTPDAWRTVASAPTRRPIVVATYDGVRGPNPVRLHRRCGRRCRSRRRGCTTPHRENPQLVCEVPCSGSAADIDTLEDLKRWTSS